MRHAGWLFSLVALLLPQTARAGSWQRLAGQHRKVATEQVLKKMRADGLKQVQALLAHRFLTRVEIRSAGGGPVNHAEIVVRLKHVPAAAVVRGWTKDRAPNRAQIGGYKKCRIPEAKGPVKPVGRTCPLAFNGKGFVDATGVLGERNVLFVFDPDRPKAGRAVLWVASDEPQVPMWYYVLPGARGVRFGSGQVLVERYEIQPGPRGTPTVPPPPDAAPEEVARPRPGPSPRPAPAARPQPSAPSLVPPPGRPAAPGPATPRARPTLPAPGNGRPPAARPLRPPEPSVQPPSNRTWGKAAPVQERPRWWLAQRLQRERVPGHEVLLRHPRLVRIDVRGSGHVLKLVLDLGAQSALVFANSWGGRSLLLAQAGREDQCRPSSRILAWAVSCPIRFNNLGWRNLSQYVKGRRLVFVHGQMPQGRSAGLIVWIAVPNGTRTRYRIWGGQGARIRVVEFRLAGAGRAIATRRRPGLAPVARQGWNRHPVQAISVPLWRVVRRMRADGLVAPATLLGHPYVVRIALPRAGGGTGRRAELGLRFQAPVVAAAGWSQTDGPEQGRAQIGPLSQCRPGLYRFLPKGWRTCPLQFNNLGWRDLSQGLAGAKEVLLISQPAAPYRGRVIVYLAFDQNPLPLWTRAYRRAGRYTLATGPVQIHVAKVTQAGGTLPSPGAAPPGYGPETSPEYGPGPEGYPGPEPAPPDTYPPEGP